MNDDGTGWALLAAFVLGAIMGGCRMDKSNEKTAIEHGAAHYDAQTGDFTWNDDAEKETPRPSGSSEGGE